MKEDISRSNYVKEKITVITLIFMMWGFITVTNGALVEELKGAIELNKLQERLLTYIFFLIYFVVSIPASIMVDKIGFKKSLLVGLVVSASCSLFMVPAARELSFSLTLAGIIVLAMGVTILQVAANPYIMLIGEKDKEASSLVGTQAFNSIGTWLAPLISMLVLTYEPHFNLNGLDGIHESLAELQLHQDKAERVVLPYILFSVILVGLTIRLHFSTLPEINNQDDLENDLAVQRNGAWQYRHVIFGALAIFCYVLAEVVIGNHLVEYIKDTLNLSQFSGMETYITAYYWGSAMVGRFVGSQLLDKVRTNKMIVIAALGAVLFLGLSLANAGVASMMLLLFIGLFNSILFPAIFALSVRRMGKFTARASGILNTAIIGGAMGVLFVNEFKDLVKERVGEDVTELYGFPVLKWALLIAVPMYIYIIYFGAGGYKRRRAKTDSLQAES